MSFDTCFPVTATATVAVAVAGWLGRRGS
ncbi:MYXO-CTERM sorting domain-containing protein [Streptomyces sp. NPDC059837]